MTIAHPPEAAEANSAAPPKAPAPSASAAVSAAVYEIDAHVAHLKRAMAGFLSLRASYLTAAGKVPPGERAKGLPVFEFSAPLFGATGGESVRCAADLKKVHADYLGHVLVPLINAQAADVMAAFVDLSGLLDQIRPTLAQLVSGEAE